VGAVAANMPSVNPMRPEAARQAAAPERARERVRQAENARGREHPQGEAGEPRRPLRGDKMLARRLERPSIRDSRGADGLAGAAAEAAPQMQCQRGVVRRDVAALERAHQLDASARPVRLVAGREVRGAGLQAEAAVDAGVEPRKAAARRRDGRRRFNRHDRRR
jgi:hypothetical protein